MTREDKGYVEQDPPSDSDLADFYSPSAKEIHNDLIAMGFTARELMPGVMEYYMPLRPNKETKNG